MNSALPGIEPIEPFDGLFARAVAEYEAMLDRNEHIDREALIQRHLAVADRLRQFLDARDFVAPNAGTEFGKYLLLNEVGRGGMGVVYRARQKSPDRIVAIKTITAGAFAAAKDVVRFLQESQLAGELRHPNIVAIHEAGYWEGRPFFSMDYIEGNDLERVFRRAPTAPKDAARLVRTIAEAVAYAHSRGVVHRDLKPSNILLDKNGTAHVTDFGLATRFESEHINTTTGTAIGTPSYMSPEQASGKVRAVSPQSDVYALGAILYSLLTARPPFEGESPLETIQQVRNHDVVPPRTLNPKVPGDLQTICLKCLEKEPRLRYTSAAEVSEELDRFLSGQAIRARPPNVFGRLWRWANRHRAVAALLLALIVSVTGGLIAVTAQLALTNSALRVAQDEKHERLNAQVDALLRAAPREVSGLLDSLVPYRAEVAGRLRVVIEEQKLSGSERLRANLLLVGDDPTLIPVLWAAIADATPEEVLLVRTVLAPFSADLAPGAWRRVLDLATPSDERIRLAGALAHFSPADARWADLSNTLVHEILARSAGGGEAWVELFRPIHGSLRASLLREFADSGSDLRSAAAALLARYDEGETARLLALLLDADPQQFRILWPSMKLLQGAVTPLLEAQLALAMPDRAETEKDAWARRQANAAIALLRLGKSDRVWPLMRHIADPRVRAYIITRAARAGVDAALFVERLHVEPNTSSVRALLQVLGGYDLPELLTAHQELPNQLLRRYRDDRDAGVHSAIGWVLRRSAVKGECDRIDELAELRTISPDRDWFVNGQGQTLVVIRGPIEFTLGAPWSDRTDTDHDRTFEREREMYIPRTFAIGAAEISNQEFSRFVQAHPTLMYFRDKHASPDAATAAVNITWVEAALYCRWLSEQEGIPEDQMCYKPPGRFSEAIEVYPDFLDRSGYRLPTDAEWEYAARAGTSTGLYYGHDPDCSAYYARTLSNSGGHAWPTCTLCPNDFGLFDVLGNADELCQDGPPDWPMTNLARFVSGLPMRDSAEKSSDLFRSVRGGSYLTPETKLAVFRRELRHSTVRWPSTGFRVARTIKSHGNPSDAPEVQKTARPRRRADLASTWKTVGVAYCAGSSMIVDRGDYLASLMNDAETARAIRANLQEFAQRMRGVDTPLFAVVQVKSLEPSAMLCLPCATELEAVKIGRTVFQKCQRRADGLLQLGSDDTLFGRFDSGFLLAASDESQLAAFTADVRGLVESAVDEQDVSMLLDTKRLVEAGDDGPLQLIRTLAEDDGVLRWGVTLSRSRRCANVALRAMARASSSSALFLDKLARASTRWGAVRDMDNIGQFAVSIELPAEARAFARYTLDLSASYALQLLMMPVPQGMPQMDWEHQQRWVSATYAARDVVAAAAIDGQIDLCVNIVEASDRSLGIDVVVQLSETDRVGDLLHHVAEMLAQDGLLSVQLDTDARDGWRLHSVSSIVKGGGAARAPQQRIDGRVAVGSDAVVVCIGTGCEQRVWKIVSACRAKNRSEVSGIVFSADVGSLLRHLPFSDDSPETKLLSIASTAFEPGEKLSIRLEPAQDGAVVRVLIPEGALRFIAATGFRGIGGTPTRAPGQSP